MQADSVLDYLPRWPRQRNLGIGCIGAGFVMDECHLAAYRQAGFQPVAIASRNIERARQVAARHGVPHAYADYRALLGNPAVRVLDVAVPPDLQAEVIYDAVQQRPDLLGILAQKPLGIDYPQALQIVETCQAAGIRLAVNQNMRYDQSVRALKSLLDQQLLGEPVLATIEMRAIPHWMPWQSRQGWLTLRIMSIHHLDTFRFWFGDPLRIFASVRPDPRTAAKFPHQDGICLYILEYANGLRAAAWDDVWAGPALEGAAADTAIRWRVEGTAGMARGTIGWPEYPKPTPSTLDYTTLQTGPHWLQPRWKEVWFPDAFAGTMAQLLCAIEDEEEPAISGRDNLRTMALVDAAYRSAREHRAIAIDEVIGESPSTAS
jgi:predicted dehydrogenase